MVRDVLCFTVQIDLGISANLSGMWKTDILFEEGS